MKKLELWSVMVAPIAASVLLSLSSCSSTVNVAAEEKSIRAAEADFAKAAAAKDLEKALSFYAEDAVLLDQNAPIATGKTAIRASWTKLLAMPDMSLTWAADNVGVARSGDLAYDYGAYRMSYTGPAGSKVEDRGKYTTVWRKLADGSWKVVLDMANTDQPAPQPAAAKKVVKKAAPKKRRR